LKTIEDDSVDLIVTDPPYGYGFMGKDWDKAVIGVDYWIECLRVLKAGAFAFIMSAPRQDVLSRMIVNLEDAGFVVGFTSIYWCFASGFPKAGNISKMVDKRMGAEREVVGIRQYASKAGNNDNFIDGVNEHKRDLTLPSTAEAKALDGSYSGFQPKPALEVVLVVMKPLAEKTYVDQALANGHGITWLDDCRVPYDNSQEDDSGQNYYRRRDMAMPENKFSVFGNDGGVIKIIPTSQGRFPANILCSDDILNDGVVSKSRESDYNWQPSDNQATSTKILQTTIKSDRHFADTGSFSRYFSLDAWWDERIKLLPESVQKTFPFMIISKASKAEKNKGCEGLEEKRIEGRDAGQDERNVPHKHRIAATTNVHPCVKPLKLFSYLITLGSREGDLILDPFAGSGTSAVACKALNRHYICIERESEYVTIAEARIKAEHSQPELQLAGG